MYPRYNIISFWMRSVANYQLCPICVRSYKDQQYLVELTEDQTELEDFCSNCGMTPAEEAELKRQYQERMEINVTS